MGDTAAEKQTALEDCNKCKYSSTCKRFIHEKERYNEYEYCQIGVK